MAESEDWLYRPQWETTERRACCGGLVRPGAARPPAHRGHPDGAATTRRDLAERALGKCITAIIFRSPCAVTKMSAPAPDPYSRAAELLGCQVLFSNNGYV